MSLEHLLLSQHPSKIRTLNQALSSLSRFGVWGLGSVVCGLGFVIWGLAFGVWRSAFGVCGLGYGVCDLGFGGWGLVFRMQNSPSASGLNLVVMDSSRDTIVRLILP